MDPLFYGGLEVVCSVLLLVPQTAGAAAGLLACTMVEAVLTHLLILRDGYAVIFAALPLVILIVVVWKRRVLPHCERKIKQGRFVTCAPRWSRASAELAGRR